jgi:hypothetical protein
VTKQKQNLNTRPRPLVRQFNFANPALLLSLTVVVLIGIYITTRLLAASYLSLEVEGGQNNSATIVVDAAASKGSYVLFGSLGTVTPSPSPSSPAWFTMASELYHDAAGAAGQFKNAGIATSFAFHAGITSAELNFAIANRIALLYFSIPPAQIGNCYPSATEANPGGSASSLTNQIANSVWLFAMPEFDQGGGCWATASGGRPQPVADRSQTLSNWMNFYKSTLGLGSILNQSATQRGYKVAATCVYAFCPQYAYDMGVDMVMLERVIDEVSAMTPGLAMIRGAAKQHGDKPWGIDFSTWRYWTSSPTEYDSNGNMTGGWSTSWFKRNFYMAFMGGSNINFAEAADVTTGGQNGGLNPFGQTLQQFSNYAVQRHPDRGTAYVPMALIQDHNSGFEPKFGQYIQADYSWYSQLPYNDGDRLLNNFFASLYPGFNSHGTLVSGGPQSVAQYRQRLANGEDPRPWEPMGNTRLGETFDVITNQASLATLQKYKTVILSLGTTIAEPLRTALNQYVAQGGIAIMTTKQMTATDQSLAGIQLSSAYGTSTSAKWSDNSQVAENSYAFNQVTPTSASILAQTGNGQPLITVNAVGQGFVYVSTANYFQDTNRANILNTTQRLIDTLSAQFAIAQVSGPSCDYLVNTSGNKILVTIVNTGGNTWNGQVIYTASTGSVREYTTDAAVASGVQGGRVIVTASVPPYDVRVFALER